jgi:hypothetical protein
MVMKSAILVLSTLPISSRTQLGTERIDMSWAVQFLGHGDVRNKAQSLYLKITSLFLMATP